MTRSILRSTLMILFVLILLPASVYALYLRFWFEPILLHSTGEHPLDVVANDINQDGVIDVVTANREGHSLSVFMGNGDGTFTPVNEVELKRGATSLAVGELTGDGVPDIGVTVCNVGCSENGILILRGLGDGRFEREVYLPVDGVPYNIALADINHDGMLDILASDAPSDRIIVMLRQSLDWKFQTDYLPGGEMPIDFVAADVDGDQVIDLAVNAKGEDAVIIHYLRSDGSLRSTARIGTDDLPYHLAVADVDQDTLPDVIVAHSSKPGAIVIHYGERSGEFRRTVSLPVESRLIFVAVGDFNLDGRVDLIATAYQSSKALIFLQIENGQFESTPFELPASNKIYSAAVAELNGDSIPDLVSVDYEDNSFSVSLGVRQ